MPGEKWHVLNIHVVCNLYFVSQNKSTTNSTHKNFYVNCGCRSGIITWRTFLPYHHLSQLVGCLWCWACCCARNHSGSHTHSKDSYCLVQTHSQSPAAELGHWTCPDVHWHLSRIHKWKQEQLFIINSFWQFMIISRHFKWFYIDYSWLFYYVYSRDWLTISVRLFQYPYGFSFVTCLGSMGCEWMKSKKYIKLLVLQNFKTVSSAK
jgi:hypothetical protein